MIANVLYFIVCLKLGLSKTMHLLTEASISLCKNRDNICISKPTLVELAEILQLMLLPNYLQVFASGE